MCKKHPRNSTLFRRRPQPNRQPRIISIIRNVVASSHKIPFQQIPAYQAILQRRKQQV